MCNEVSNADLSQYIARDPNFQQVAIQTENKQTTITLVLQSDLQSYTIQELHDQRKLIQKQLDVCDGVLERIILVSKLEQINLKLAQIVLDDNMSKPVLRRQNSPVKTSSRVLISKNQQSNIQQFTLDTQSIPMLQRNDVEVGGVKYSVLIYQDLTCSINNRWIYRTVHPARNITHSQIIEQFSKIIHEKLFSFIQTEMDLIIAVYHVNARQMLRGA